LSLRSGKPNISVAFFVDGKRLGAANTNSKRIAVLETDARAPRTRTHTAHATYKGQHLTAEGRWFTWEPNRTVIAVDIDDTVCRTNYGDLFLSDFDRVSEPVEAHDPALS